MSRLRWATAIATLLFVFAFSADLLGNVDTSGGDDDDSAVFVERPMTTGSGAEATSASGATAAEEEAADDVARNAVETPNPAGASEDEAAGSGPAPTEASGNVAVPTQAAAATGEEEEAPPAADASEPTVTDAETMLTIETAEPEQDNTAQQEDQSIAAYGGEDTSAENRESNTLHLIELALVITIAWLVVAMIALPRLRRPTG
jgi:hypothetical protein